MNEKLMINLLKMFIDQFTHAVTVAEHVLLTKGAKALKEEIQAEFDGRVTKLNKGIDRDVAYDFQDALVLSSLLLIGLLVDLHLDKIEIVEVGDHAFELVDQDKTQ